MPYQPYKRKYGRYLEDPSCEVPLRSRYRFQKAAEREGREDDIFAACGIDNDPQQPASDVSADVLEAHGNASPLYEPPNEAASVGLCNQNDSLSALNHSWNETDNSEWRSSGESVDDSSSEYSSGESSSLDEDDGQDERTDQQEQTKMDDPLYPGARISKAESVLLIMAHSLRHSASKEATESVLKLVEAHLPDGTGFPSTNKGLMGEPCGLPMEGHADTSPALDRYTTLRPDRKDRSIR
ncbi:hypothetical protein HPB49_008189 [Dermacentor silvarum]|uniref:Uncharacterized protein n=1 Tax=Dermacentor silvarum TaxID=543639 RepID=A0ACB8CE39_DERSI|nr:hypothetical protein HPB49_008189 [Dermacentor silvarum]